MKDYIERVINPRLMGDGGWVEFVSLEGDRLTLLFRGECSKCAILDRCCDWIARQAEGQLGQKVVIVPQCRKPFFWDHQ